MGKAARHPNFTRCFRNAGIFLGPAISWLSAFDPKRTFEWDQRPTQLPPVLCSSSRAKSFTDIQSHFLRGRMIMSAQPSSGTRRSTTAGETNTLHPPVKHCADKVHARYKHGRPDSELVPSRYALKVGAIDVMVVSDGVLSLPSAMLGHNVDPAIRANPD